MGQGPLKRNTVERFKRENAPVRLNDQNEITTLTELERKQSGKHESPRCLEHSGTIEQQVGNDYEVHRHKKNIGKKEKTMLNTKA